MLTQLKSIRKKEETHIGGLIFGDTKVQFPMEEVEPQFNAVTTRGMGGSQFLDTLTVHGDGSIGNQNNMESEEHTGIFERWPYGSTTFKMG